MRLCQVKHGPLVSHLYHGRLDVLTREYAVNPPIYSTIHVIVDRQEVQLGAAGFGSTLCSGCFGTRALPPIPAMTRGSDPKKSE